MSEDALDSTTEDAAASAKADNQLEVAASVVDAYERGKQDINFFAGLCLPEVCDSPLPAFYVLIWQLLTYRDAKYLSKILRFALGLPRGHAKTTFIKILITWLIVYDKVSFVLIVCASETLAENLLADIDDMLASDNMEAVYGRWAGNLSTDRTDLKKAMYHNRAIILAAKGAGSSLRGINLKHKRPDLIFCDDVQTRENDKSETERKNLLEWLTGTLFRCIAVKGDRYIIYLGNMYSEDCILNQFQKNSKWLSLITGAILADGTPLWPDLFSLEDLMEGFEHDEELGLGDLWFAEVMNDPVNSKNSLLPHLLPAWPEEIPTEDLDPDGAYLTVDPAGFKTDSDDNVISLHYVYDGKDILWDRKYGKDIADPEQLVLESLTMALESGASLIAVEDVAYQSTLQFWYRKYMTDLNIKGIDIVPISPKGRSKESRIRVYIQDLYAGNSLQHPRARPLFVFYATKFKPGFKKNKDDILDCDAYGIDVRTEYWGLVQNNRRKLLEQATTGVATVEDDNTPF